MRSTTKIAVTFCGMFLATLFSMAIANSPRQPVNCMQDICHLSQRVEFFQNQKGETFELNYLDKNDMARFQLNGGMAFSPAGDCTNRVGNCSTSAKAGHYVVVLSN